MICPIRKVVAWIFSAILLAIANLGYGQNHQITITIDTNKVINKSYIGNGAQWDPYQLDYGKAQLQISEQDWQKLYDRLDFMRPQLMRVMINIGSYAQNEKLKFSSKNRQLFKILRYCTSRDVTVIFGDWGGGLVNARSNRINRRHITAVAQLVDYLINKKGFTAIKYVNIINEPNGSWSAADGNYQLWTKSALYLHKQFKARNLTDKISIVGPDVAIWSPQKSWWIDSTASDLGSAVGLYDIHTYPSRVTVNSGQYSDIINAYKKKVPSGKKIVMGEIGLKFIKDADSTLQKENLRRAKAKKYASTKDSQMFVYDYIYGIDMADALFQAVNAGYSGSVVWMLDDAMHSKEAKYKLKVWGFWNILGDEFFGAREENVRPWYYAWSLLTKYMPAGARVFKVRTSGNKAIKAIAVEKDGKFMIAAVNVSNKDTEVQFKSKQLSSLSHMKQFVYSKATLQKKGDHQIIPNKNNLTLNLKSGVNTSMPNESLIVYTNFDY